MVLRLGQPVVREIDGDDPLRSGQACADHRAEPDEPAAEDDTRRTRLDARRVEHRTDAGRETAGERRAPVEWRFGGHLRERDLGHDRVFRERRRAHEVAERLSAHGEPTGSVREIALALLVADGHTAVRPRAPAVDALAALRSEERDDVIAFRDERYPLAHLLDDTGALMPEHARGVPAGIGSRRRVEIGMADAASDEPDEHFTRLRFGEVHLLDDERLPELLEHGGADLHAAPFEGSIGRIIERPARGDYVLVRTGRTDSSHVLGVLVLMTTVITHPTLGCITFMEAHREVEQ